jgi:hypothetical protein
MPTISPNDNVVKFEPFEVGWPQGQSAWGRPADVDVARRGSC